MNPGGNGHTTYSISDYKIERGLEHLGNVSFPSPPQVMALQWLRDFLAPAGPEVVLGFVPGILVAVLPLVSCDANASPQMRGE